MIDVLCPSIISFSSHTSEARGLKIGVHNSYIDGSKVTDQILIFYLEAQILKFKVLYLRL